MKVLLTGAAGFIGMHVAQRLLARGDEVLGLDNLNAYYDPRLKRARLARLADCPGFAFREGDVADPVVMQEVFASFRPRRVVHLAAQAGVRYSLVNPHAYVQSNLTGFAHVLEGCRHAAVEHLVFASSSSVYGANLQVPFSEAHRVDHPVSFYAATKRANELMAHSYSHLYGFPSTGLRYFTVYGPWGRPDMSPWLFSSAILEGRSIDVFNEGRMQRDFTFVDDIAEGTVRVLDHLPAPDPESGAPWCLYNIGHHQPVELMRFIEILEQALGRKAVLQFRPMQPGDVVRTYADTSRLQAAVGFAPTTALEEGLARWAGWYLSWRKAG